jgi:hypothetical protein
VDTWVAAGGYAPALVVLGQFPFLPRRRALGRMLDWFQAGNQDQCGGNCVHEESEIKGRC